MILRWTIIVISLLSLIGCPNSSSTKKSRSRHQDKKITMDYNPQESLIFNGEGDYGGRLIIGIIEDPKSFNPILAVDENSKSVLLPAIFSTLITYDHENNKSLPYLAKDWSSSLDGLLWTFKLRKGIVWSDGEPFTADDVLFTFTVVMDNAIPNTLKYHFVAGEKKKVIIQKVDNYTVTMKLTEVNILFEHAVSAVPILPKHVYEKNYREGQFLTTLQVDTKPENIVSIGPYLLENYEPGVKITLIKNPYYFRYDLKKHQLPYFDEVVFTIIPDKNAQSLKFQNGELDLLDSVRSEDYALLKEKEEDGKYTVFDLGPDDTSTFLFFNQNEGKDAKGQPLIPSQKLKWFKDKHFRQAVSYAIDRAGIIKACLDEKGVESYQPFSERSEWWYSKELPPTLYSLDKAKELLKSSGYYDRNNDTIIEDNEGHKVSFTFMTNSDNSMRVAMGTLIQSDLRKLGMEVSFSTVPLNQVLNYITETKNFDLILIGLSEGRPADPAMGLNVYLSSGRLHMWYPEQKKPVTEWEGRIDTLMRQLLTSADLQKRQETWFEVLRILNDEMPMIYTVRSKAYVAIKNSIKNVNPRVYSPRAYSNISELYKD